MKGESCRLCLDSNLHALHRNLRVQRKEKEVVCVCVGGVISGYMLRHGTVLLEDMLQALIMASGYTRIVSTLGRGQTEQMCTPESVCIFTLQHTTTSSHCRSLKPSLPLCSHSSLSLPESSNTIKVDFVYLCLILKGFKS